MDKRFIIIFTVLLVLVGVTYWLEPRKQSEQSQKEFEVTEHELIRVTYPMPGDNVTSPLIIEGEALIIADHYAEAQGEWMTEDFVPFKAELEFEKPEYGERGTLILQKNNPSGLKDHDDAHEITVFFK